MIDSLEVAEAVSKQARKKVKNIWQPTFIEAYGKTVTDYTNQVRRDINVKALSSLALRSFKSNGAPWDFRTISDRHEALKMIDDLDSDWVIGAPPCTASSIWNYALDSKKIDTDAIREKLGEGWIHRMNIRFCCRMY